MTPQSTQSIHYRPFLLTKAAEWRALQNLEAKTLEKITPVYVVAPLDWDYEKDCNKKTLDEHITKIVAEIAAIGTIRHAFIDVTEVESGGNLANGLSPMSRLINETAALGVTLNPMISTKSSPATVAAAKTVLSTSDRTVGINLIPNEWPSTAPAILTNLLASIGVGVDRVDLFLNAGDALGTFAAQAVVTELGRLHGLGTFHSTTFAGSAWPKTLPTGAGNYDIPRADYATFIDVIARCVSGGVPVPDYADWTITNPDTTLGVDPKILNIAAQFRYSAEDSWVLGKGALYKGNGGKSQGAAAVPPMLNKLATHAKYGSTITTKTETWINNARVSGPSGNPTTWRQWGVLRHLELTVHQLAKLP
ncbi:beta family protein [Rhodococcus erythropolis]|uniref:beta family protein n=1 Tax=Rhodococcus erythropolis TaxID=1833 RepID=UPI0037AAE7D9